MHYKRALEFICLAGTFGLPSGSVCCLQLGNIVAIIERQRVVY